MTHAPSSLRIALSNAIGQIVSVGDPYKKYTKMEKIGQGWVGVAGGCGCGLEEKGGVLEKIGNRDNRFPESLGGRGRFEWSHLG